VNTDERTHSRKLLNSASFVQSQRSIEASKSRRVHGATTKECKRTLRRSNKEIVRFRSSFSVRQFYFLTSLLVAHVPSGTHRSSRLVIKKNCSDQSSLVLYKGCWEQLQNFGSCYEIVNLGEK